MKNKTRLKIGIIAEDDSDVDSLQVLIKKITNKNIATKRFVGKGCGKLKRKCSAWSFQLKNRGCNLLIFIHDLDRWNLNELNTKLLESLLPSAIAKYIICIPIEEMEAWFLSDPRALRDAMNLKRIPNIKGLPESIKSPKEYLGQIIFSASNGDKIYLNTKHNVKISEHVSIDSIKNRCPSFNPLYEFIMTHCSQ